MAKNNKKENNSEKNKTPVSMPPISPKRQLLSWIILVGVVILLFNLWDNPNKEYKKIVLQPDFYEMLESGMINEIEVYHEASENPIIRIEGEIPEKVVNKTEAGKEYPRNWYVQVDKTSYDTLIPSLTEKNIGIEHKVISKRFENIITLILPTLLLFFLIYILFIRQMKSSNSAMNFGKSRAKLMDGNQPVKFKDVAGIDESKEEVEEIVEFLKNPKKFHRLGGRMPRGILLCGPPGTGKTLLAKAIAGEAGVPFFSISGSDFVEMFVGVGASRVRDMFEQAKKNSPSIVFIDEIDAVGRSRGTGIGGGHDEREQTLNALLVEMDGFEANQSVVVMAATNRPDVLDKALLRPGRFDRQVVVELPSLNGREEILKVHIAKIKAIADVDISRIARGTPGFAGADLANLVNEAALIAARKNKEFVDIDDFEEARDKVMWGKERRSKRIDEEDRNITAYHEAGHAILTVVSPNMDPLHKITIIPRGMSLGSTMFLPKKDRTHVSKGFLLDDLVVCMGGRVAEELFLKDICTGARQDIAQATQLARSMVCEWGMSDVLGPRSFGKNEEYVFLGREVNRSQDYSEKTAQLIDTEVDRLLKEAHDKATQLLTENKAAVETLAKLLLDKETVDGVVAEEIVKYGRPRTPEERGEEPPEVPPPPPVPADEPQLEAEQEQKTDND